MMCNFFITLFAILLSACIGLPIEHDGWLTARHSGVVRDKITGQTIAGAKITLTSKYTASIITETVSAADGTFTIGPVTRQERLYLVLPDSKEGTCADTLDIKHAGYMTEKVQWSAQANTTGGVCRNINATHLISLHQ